MNLKYAGDVATLLKEVSKQGKVALESGTTLRDAILVVYLKDAPLKEVMERIAWTAYGRWEPNGSGGYRLGKDPDLLKKKHLEYVANATKVLSEGISKYRKQVRGADLSEEGIRRTIADWKAKEAKSFPMPTGTTSMVAERALATALDAVDPAVVAKDGSEFGVTYSDKPTHAQLPLGRAGDEVIRKYNEEILRWEKATAGAGAPSSALPAAVAVLNISYVRGGMATLTLYSADGNLVARAFTHFDDPSYRQFQLPKPVMDAIPVDVPIKLSPESRFYALPKDKDGRYPPSPAEIPDVVNRLRSPEKYDPLSTLCADLWANLAERMGKSVVVDPPDYLFPPQIPPEHLTMMGYLPAQFGDDTQIDSRWIVSRPAPDPAWIRPRIHRAALGRLVRVVPGDALANLQASAELAWLTPEGNWDYEVRSYLYWARPGMNLASENPGFLRAFGSLPRDIQKAWVGGQPIAISGLGSGTRHALLRWALHESTPQTYQYERTVRFPNGDPDKGFLRADIISTPGFYIRIRFPDKQVAERSISGHDLAIDLNTLARGENQWMKDFDIQETPKRQFRLYADLGGGDVVEGMRSSGEAVDPSKYVPWAMAPPEMKARLAELQKQVKKEFWGGE